MSQKWVIIFPKFSGFKHKTNIWSCHPPPRKTRLDTTSPSSFLPVKPSTSWNRFGFFCSCRIAKSVPPRMSWGPWWHEAGTSTICAKMLSSFHKKQETDQSEFHVVWSFISCCLVMSPNLYLEDPKLLKSGRVMWLESTCPESSGFKVRRFVPFIWQHYLTREFWWTNTNQKGKMELLSLSSCQTNN